MKTIQLEISNTIDLSETEIKLMLAGELYERGKLSLGQCASLTVLTKRTFVELMGKYGFSIFSTSHEDLRNDVENA
ncbi:MAG: UPF0175 family protein [Bacteroidota bacterium]